MIQWLNMVNLTRPSCQEIAKQLGVQISAPPHPRSSVILHIYPRAKGKQSTVLCRVILYVQLISSCALNVRSKYKKTFKKLQRLKIVVIQFIIHLFHEIYFQFMKNIKVPFITKHVLLLCYCVYCIGIYLTPPYRYIQF